MKYCSYDIVNKFLDFFSKNDHLKIEGSSVIPKNDPTLLYINAGMAAIKNYFTGSEIPKCPRLCNVQSCIRTIDIDDIGDRYHLTSFQMLGSWSIGDYFKSRAIELAFDFLVNSLKIPVDKLYVSVFSGNTDIGLSFDDESKQNWKRVGIPESHIVSLGMEDNFWGPAGDTGPCGPCTEVFFDTGVGTEYTGDFFDTSRYIEIWNAGVFMMLNKNSDGSFSELPFKSVDTGAGLERLSMTMNNLNSVYDIDILSPIRNFISSRILFENDHDRNVRILTDHLRTVSLILSENQKITNEGRGYIPRKLIRKCVSIANKSKKKTDISEFIDFICENYDINYKVKQNKKRILSLFSEEKDKFQETLDLGMTKLISMSKSGYLSGKDAFDLVTTFGFPFEEIMNFSIQNSINVDKDEFKKLIENHKKISRTKGSIFSSESKIFTLISDISKTNFLGYDSLECECKILKIFSRDLHEISNSSGHSSVFIITDSTVIYATGGGQESDSGFIFSNGEFIGDVEYAIKNDGIFVQYCQLTKDIAVGDHITIKVDSKRREGLSRAHSATHLLQSVLKNLFGSELHQSGSKVDENCLRFDFNLTKKLVREDICKIEQEVNKLICKNINSKTCEMGLSDAIKDGATALFSEKYDKSVRVVSFGDISKELCGGTHVKSSGQIGAFIVSSYESVGKGIKRISAFTSSKAINYVQNFMNQCLNSCEILHVKIDDLFNSVKKLNSKKKNNISNSIKKISKSELNFFETKTPFAYYVCEDKFSSNLVTDTCESISGIFLVVSSDGKRVSLATCKNSKLSALDLIKPILTKLGGKGGGNERIASGGLVNKIAEEIINSFRNQYENTM